MHMYSKCATLDLHSLLEIIQVNITKQTYSEFGEFQRLFTPLLKFYVQ